MSVEAYAERLDDPGRLFTLALRAHRTRSEGSELVELYRRLGFEAVREGARANQIEALVAWALEKLLPAGELPGAWRQLLHDNQARVVGLVEVLGEVTERLSRVGCPCMTVESGGVLLGSTLALAAYGPGDIDLLVARGQLDTARRACLEAGGVEAERGRPTLRRTFRWERGHASSLWIEVCDRPFDRSWVALPYRDRSLQWLARAQRSSRTPEVVVPAPTDALVFAAIHTSLHAFVRPPGLRLHVDVDRIVADGQVQWEQAVREIREVGLPTRAFVSLAMARGLLGTPVPDDALEALCPSAWRWRWLRGLLESESVLEDGRPKLAGARALLLDALVDDRPMAMWLARTLVPPGPWMETHFGDGSARLWRRHVDRLEAALRPGYR